MAARQDPVLARSLATQARAEPEPARRAAPTSNSPCSSTLSPQAPALRRDALGDRLAAVAELPPDDLASLLNVIDGLVAKNRLKALTGGLS